MRFYDLFGGIGGFRLGLQKAGELVEATTSVEPEEASEVSKGKRGRRQRSDGCFECVGYCDWDKFAVECYNENFKESHEPNDATKIDPAKLPDFDLLCAGFPCQSFSLAGKRKGFQDIRGTLFYEIVRIAEAKKPRLLLLENVKGLLSNDSGRSFYAILVSLEKLGYRLEWEVLNSKNFGVPQNRERVFIVGSLGDGSAGQVFPLGQGLKVLGTEDEGEQGGGAGVCSALDSGCGRLRGQGENYVKERGEPRIMNVPHGFNEGWVKRYPNLRAEGDSAHNELLIFDAQNKKFVDNSPSLLSGGLSHFSNFSPIVVSKQKTIRRLTPVECERLQGFPDGWTGMLSDTQRYKTLGNAVTTNVVQAIGEQIMLGDGD